MEGKQRDGGMDEETERQREGLREAGTVLLVAQCSDQLVACYPIGAREQHAKDTGNAVGRQQDVLLRL